MPAYFTAKQERQYEHIKKSCVTRRCRRKSKRCVSTCKRIAAATVNKFRGRRKRGVAGLGNPRQGRCCVVKNKRKIACFTDKQQAIDFKAAIRRTRGTRVFCFRKQS